jgi:hypothetical protein
MARINAPRHPRKRTIERAARAPIACPGGQHDRDQKEAGNADGSIVGGVATVAITLETRSRTRCPG